MDNLNLVVMGKTGAGKSTLINAVLEEELAPTGVGQAVTTENKIYSKEILLPVGGEGARAYMKTYKRLNLYDTVGLEIDNLKTERTLKEVQKLIGQAQTGERENDITLVWFCVNSRSSRFESYEVNLIKKLSFEHEIPFVVVITQCYTEERGELEKQIAAELPELAVVRVLAKEYKTRAGTAPAFGLHQLLRQSVTGYNQKKITILESKLAKLLHDRQDRILALQERGKRCVSLSVESAQKIGRVPIGCVPFVYKICRRMIADLNRIVGINPTEGFASEIFADAVLGVIAMPLMSIPFLSSPAAAAFVETVGDDYLKALMSTIEQSSDEDLTDSALMARRIKEELKKRKK